MGKRTLWTKSPRARCGPSRRKSRQSHNEIGRVHAESLGLPIWPGSSRASLELCRSLRQSAAASGGVRTRNVAALERASAARAAKLKRLRPPATDSPAEGSDTETEEMEGTVVESRYSLALLERLAAHSQRRRAAQPTIPLPSVSWERLETEEAPESASADADELADDEPASGGAAMDEEPVGLEGDERPAAREEAQPAAEQTQPAAEPPAAEAARPARDASSVLLAALMQYRTVLLDVRGAEARQAQPLPIASRWCPLDQNDSEPLTARAEALLPHKGATIVAFGDEHGNTSALAKEALERLGYSRVVNAGCVGHVIACLAGACEC